MKAVRGYSKKEIQETFDIQDVLAENFEDFQALLKLKGMTPDMPGYAGFARAFAQNIIRDRQLRAELTGPKGLTGAQQ